MKGMIDSRGFLMLDRRGKTDVAICPFSGSERAFCGDWCPLFDDSYEPNAVWLGCSPQGRKIDITADHRKEADHAD